MSRPFGSGFAVSKSISASAASMGRDFLYPTAFMRRFSLVPAAIAGFRHYVLFHRRNCKDGNGKPCGLVRLRSRIGPEPAAPGLPVTSIRKPGSLYSHRQAFRNPFMIVVRIFTALFALWAATAPALSHDRRVPASPAELTPSY